MKTKHLVVIADSRKMPELENESVHLVVTSPPYFNVKNYGSVAGNIGAIDDYLTYLRSMETVFRECYRVLQTGRYICVNISDVISGGRKYPIPGHFVFLLEQAGFTYREDMIWKKPDGIGQNAGSGAAKRFGILIQHPYPMYYYPNNVYEHILVFRKGVFNFRKPTTEQKLDAKLDIDEAMKRWNTDIWAMAPETATAMLPARRPLGRPPRPQRYRIPPTISETISDMIFDLISSE